jgi:hypothetical protein
MGWRRATKRKRNPQRTDLSQLKEELGRVSEKFESCQGEFAESLDQHVHDFKREVETELPDSTLQAISVACLLLSPVRGK